MIRTHSCLLFAACGLLGCAAGPSDEECVEERREIGFGDPGPWGLTPQEVYLHATGEREGLLEWKGGGDVLDVVPSSGETGLVAELSFDSAAAEAIDASKTGEGRLFCSDRMETAAALRLETNDGALSENLTVTAIADGSFANPVFVRIDLEQTELAGSLEVALKEGIEFDDEGLFLDVRWDENGSGLVRGELFYGGQSKSGEADGIISGTGVVHSFGTFQGEYP